MQKIKTFLITLFASLFIAAPAFAVDVQMGSNGNLVFDVDKAFAQKVLDKVNIARFPYMVHKVAKSTYSIENEAQNLTNLIRLLS